MGINSVSNKMYVPAAGYKRTAFDDPAETAARTNPTIAIKNKTADGKGTVLGDAAAAAKTKTSDAGYTVAAGTGAVSKNVYLAELQAVGLFVDMKL